ncbi:MAG: alkaline phosphatase family protein [Myxococcota bacterium]
MLTTVCRSLAIGVLLGCAVAFDVARITPDLSARPGAAWLLAGPIVLLYAAMTGAIGALLGGIAALAPRLRGLTSRRFCWGAALLFAGYVCVNEASHSVPLVKSWRFALRGALGVATAALLVSVVRHPALRQGLLRSERVLAAGLVLAAIGSGVYVAKASPRARSSSAPVDLSRLAPRFTPEPEPLEASLRRDRRILLVGLDGASWDRIERGVATGDLPTFARLMRRGRHVPLHSFVPTYSPLIWTSIVTGVPPEVHGVDEFYLIELRSLGIDRLHLRKAYSPVRSLLDSFGDLRRIPVTSTLRKSKAIWNLADEAGLRSAVLGLWATWPPERLAHGLVVSDHASLARRYEWLVRHKTSTLTPGTTTWPPALEDRLADLQRDPMSVTREELAEFMPVDDATWAEFQAARRFSKAEPLSAFRSTFLNDGFFLAAAERLWTEANPQLMVVYARAIDELSHFFYDASADDATRWWSTHDVDRFEHVVDRTYAWTDRWLARLVELVDRDPRTLLIVCSDHGWEWEPENGKYDHNLAPDGILILYGNDVCTSAGCPLERQASVYDIAPTILERLGLPLSDELVGRPLRWPFRSSGETLRVAHYQGRSNAVHSLASEIGRDLNQQLRALGYAD